MKNYITLAVYTSICLITGISFAIQLKKNLIGDAQTAKAEFDGLILLGLLLAFFTALKELIEAINKIREAFKTDKQNYLKLKRKEGKIEVDVDGQASEDNIIAIRYVNVFKEGVVRQVGDEAIGYQQFVDVFQECTLHGMVRTNRPLTVVKFEFFSDLPITNVDLIKYLNVSCTGDRRRNLSFNVYPIENSLHKFAVIIDLGREYTKGEKFVVRCQVTVPFCLAAAGPECLYASANYYLIKEHTAFITFRNSKPDFLTVKILNAKKQVNRLLSRPEQAGNWRFEITKKNVYRESKFQFEFSR